MTSRRRAAGELACSWLQGGSLGCVCAVATALAMPRGGNHRPDGFSPYKHPDGRVLKILKSSKSKTGYLNIVELRGWFWAKKKLDATPGSKQARFFGKSDTCASGARTQDPPLPHPSLLSPSPSGKSVLPGPRTLLSFPAVCGRVRPPLSPTCVFESESLTLQL